MPQKTKGLFFVFSIVLWMLFSALATGVEELKNQPSAESRKILQLALKIKSEGRLVEAANILEQALIGNRAVFSPEDKQSAMEIAKEFRRYVEVNPLSTELHERLLSLETLLFGEIQEKDVDNDDLLKKEISTEELKHPSIESKVAPGFPKNLRKEKFFEKRRIDELESEIRNLKARVSSLRMEEKSAEEVFYEEFRRANRINSSGIPQGNPKVGMIHRLRSQARESQDKVFRLRAEISNAQRRIAKLEDSLRAIKEN